MQSGRNCTIATVAASAALVALLVLPLLTRASDGQQLSDEDERRNAMKQDLMEKERATRMKMKIESLDVEGSEIFWHQSYDKAITQAKLTGKPIFLEFRCVP